MNAYPDLLILRLRALGLDVAKVKVAVAHANRRGELLEQAQRAIRPCRGKLRWVETHLNALIQATRDEPEIVGLLTDAGPELDQDLEKAPARVGEVIDAVHHAFGLLEQAMETAVPLADHSQSLENSLKQRCTTVSDKITALETLVETEDPAQRRTHWETYQALLDTEARPIFVEYVDFLGGVAMRDTGLDDRVCDMTDALLTRFKGVTPGSSLPLPARQAALGNALESVVLLGFPEWSIWGIPLVAHEVGLACVKNRNDERLTGIVRKYVRDDKNTPADERRTVEYVHQLVADAFAAYTLGLAYGCAALLLRLNPNHDERGSHSDPRDIDRARVIRMAVQSGQPGGGTFTDDLERLWAIWRNAVEVHAGAARAAAARDEVQGPAPENDWLDDFSRDVVERFDDLVTVRRFDADRWRGSEQWKEALVTGVPGPTWIPEDDAVPEVLTAAWRLRLVGAADPDVLAAEIKRSWSARPRRGVR